MERNRLKAKEDILQQTEELIQAISDADIQRCNQARKKFWKMRILYSQRKRIN